MGIMAFLSAARRIYNNIDLNHSHGSCGVGIVKLQKHYFMNPAGKEHDEAYKRIDWDKGSYVADMNLLTSALALAKTEEERQEARAAFVIARTYGRLRYGLAKIGVTW